MSVHLKITLCCDHQIKKAVLGKLVVTGCKTGNITWKASDAKIKISKKGKVTLKKGLAANTYTIKVKAKANENYKKAVIYFTITVS